MYCQDCNTHNSLDSKYCKECGAKINSGYRTLMLSIQDLPLHQSEEDVEKLTRLLDMAFWHNQAGNQAAAITACLAALALNPNSTTAHSLLGTLYEKSGDDAQAIHHFESVLSLNPDSQADAAKLDQLRRGVHVRATAPPISHQWLPPVFLKLGPQIGKRLSELSAAPLAAGTTSQRRPLYAAGGATALVLVAGLLVTHPWASAETVKTYPVTTPVAPAPVAIAQSAFAPGTQIASATAPPMVLTPSHANIQMPVYVPPVITSRDPFTGPAPTAAVPASAAVWSLPAVPRRAAAVRRTNRGLELPPLRLAALSPVGTGGVVSGGVAPAPVFLPDGVAFSGSALSAVPRHTVVVGGYSSSLAPSTSPYQSNLSSHIQITVHQARDTEGSSAPAAGSLGASDDGQGEIYQQRALSLQEAGSYAPAKQAYQSAIRSYQTQIAAGRDIETAKRGLSACQTGLQICQQSQP